MLLNDLVGFYSAGSSAINHDADSGPVRPNREVISNSTASWCCGCGKLLAGVADDPGDQVEIREDAEADVSEESSKVDFLKCPGGPSGGGGGGGGSSMQPHPIQVVVQFLCHG